MKHSQKSITSFSTDMHKILVGLIGMYVKEKGITQRRVPELVNHIMPILATKINMLEPWDPNVPESVIDVYEVQCDDCGFKWVSLSNKNVKECKKCKSPNLVAKPTKAREIKVDGKDGAKAMLEVQSKGSDQAQLSGG